MAHSPLDHVKDAHYFETSETLGLGWEEHGHYGIHLPEIAGLQVTKFMVLQVVAAIIVMLVLYGLGRKVRSGSPVRGRFWNFWEALVMFLRNEVVRPTIGDGHHDHGEHGHDEHGPTHDPNGMWHGHDPAHQGGAYMAVEGKLPDDHGEAAADRLAEHGSGPLSDMMASPHVEGGPHPADKYLPFVGTLFFYILVCNLLGMIPWMGSATGDISVTLALAGIALVFTFVYGIQAMGASGFAKNLCPGGVPPVLIPLVWVIEALGLFIKHGVLAVRLFANMMAGHVVLAVFLGFIAMEGVAGTNLFYAVAPTSVLAQVAISLLELFVAFLQAYIFAFLATLFIASVIHEH
jgi:F-type H+-transporting ATPase subunit a